MSDLRTKAILVLSVLLIINLSCFSQEIIKKTKKDKYDLTETFYVLKSDKSIRQGEYSMHFGNVLIQEGSYNNGKKKGIWEYFSVLGLEFKYDFDSDRIVSDTIGKKRTALFSEGESYFCYLLLKYLVYPDEAKTSGIQGNVIIQFTVGIDGVPKNFIVKRGNGNQELNNEAIQTVKKAALENSWYPAINDKGEKVASTVEYPINFQIR